LDSLFIVRFDYSELLPQSSGKRGGGWFLLYITCVCGGRGRGEEEGGAGNKRSSQDYQDLQGRARQFTPGQTGLPIILCLGKTTLSQDLFPAIHKFSFENKTFAFPVENTAFVSSFENMDSVPK
jgi:hypothetical protein